MTKIRKMLAILFAVALIATACGDDDSGGGNGFSSDIVDGYMQGCTTEQSVAFCQCTLDEIEKRFTEEEFIAFAIEATEAPPDEFIEIAFACLGEADLGE
jgi:hypothetical protein